MKLWESVQRLPMAPPWRTLRGRVALLLGAALAPAGVHAFYSGAFAPVLIWLTSVAVSWGAVHVFIARPLLSIEVVANAYARGDAASVRATPLQNAPAEISSLHRSLVAMSAAIRGREKVVADAIVEQRALLREVNHRVMNNLQVVLSVLSIQSRDAESADQRLALARARGRVQLLAVTQSHIYAAGDVHDVRLDQIVAETARTVIETRTPRMQPVILSLELDPVRTTTDRAAAIAFLIAESLSLVLSKISGDQPAKVILSLRNLGKLEIEFSISAPGVAGALDGSKTDGRLISDMARDVGATIVPDPDQSMNLHMRIRIDDTERAEE